MIGRISDEIMVKVNTLTTLLNEYVHIVCANGKIFCILSTIIIIMMARFTEFPNLRLNSNIVYANKIQESIL